ncbi:MAG: M20/M25/M40 family metallo-hydrolase [Oscillospiraceae bacterium]|nr:M20/M25/M40 family metallo-hydrolase [Oscillospiraceae bacterium]
MTTRPGALMPRSAEVNMYINGVAAHGTSPFEGVDALYIATDYVQSVYREHAKMAGAVPHFKDGQDGLSFIAAETPDQRTIIHMGLMESGYARNIVSDYTHLKGTIRAYDDETFARLVDILTGQLSEMEGNYGCTTDFNRSEGYPPVVNNPALFGKIEGVLKAMGDGYVPLDMPLMISEDFSFYGRYKPAVFFLLGTGTGIPLHSTNFDFDETVLMSGFKLYKSLCQHTDFTL